MGYYRRPRILPRGISNLLPTSNDLVLCLFLQKDDRLRSSGLLQNVPYTEISTKLPTSPVVPLCSNVYSCMELERGWSGLSLNCIS